jgi:CheY-like chemotaxis protein
MARLVDDLLDVSRLELGKVQLQLQPLDLNSAVAAATEACLPVTSARGHRMDVRLAREPLFINADPVRLEQIIGNLVTNAAKFTPEGGDIRVEVSGDAHRVTVVVRDSGVGIRPDMLDSVFELFTQDSATIERSQGGLGIGLTIVKRLIELHGGRIEVRSAGVGHGAQFTCSFARVHDAAVPDAGAGQVVGGLSPRRVLVIEDNADIRESLGLLLTMWGHGVEFAETGPDGLLRAHAEQPDVALIDIGLPGLNGYEVARRIRSAGSEWARGVKLVALTGYGRDTDRDEALDAGFDHHLVKPIDPDVLARTLQAR